MSKLGWFLVLLLLFLVGFGYYLYQQRYSDSTVSLPTATPLPSLTPISTPTPSNPLGEVKANPFSEVRFNPFD